MHKTTGFVNQRRTNVYLRTILYRRKFWRGRPKLSPVQNCSLVHICLPLVHKTSCFVPYHGGNSKQDKPALYVDSTQITFWVLQSHKLLYSRWGRIECGCESCIKESYDNTCNTDMTLPFGPAIWQDQIPWRIFGTALSNRVARKRPDRGHSRNGPWIWNVQLHVFWFCFAYYNRHTVYPPLLLTFLSFFGFEDPT